jgi:hypothetical protein
MVFGSQSGFPPRLGGAARAGRQQDTLEESGPAPRRLRVAPDASSAGAMPLHGSQRVGGIELPEVARLDQEPGRIPRRSSRRQAISVICSPVPSIPAESSTRQGRLWRRRRAARAALVLGVRDQPLAEVLLFERRTLGVPGRVRGEANVLRPWYAHSAVIVGLEPFGPYRTEVVYRLGKFRAG